MNPTTSRQPSIEIRSETTADHDTVRALLDASFGGRYESRLVARLRESGKAVISLVAMRGERVVGHILFSPVTLEGDATPRPALGLAPVAVSPERQNQGVGTELTRAGLDACRALDCEAVVVLGQPEYYRRFGFLRADQFGLQNEYGADEAFMVLELRPGALAGRAGLVQYAPEFAEAEHP
jgi:putative acetyltransferase